MMTNDNSEELRVPVNIACTQPDTNKHTRRKLNWLNYLNLPAFLVNVLVNFLYGMGSSSDEDIGSTSDQYKSVVTPAGWAFSIWSIIFVMQGVFTIVQFMSRFRASQLVQQGVSYYYILACIFQSGWVFAFTNHVIWLSLVLIILILASLLSIVVSQYHLKYERSYLEYWLFCFPFSIHCAWITAATLINTNVLIVDLQVSAPAQLASGIISLAILHAVSVHTLFGINKPDYVFPLVYVWANGAIASELSNPDQSIVSRFHVDIIDGVRYAAATVSIIIMIQIVVSIATQLARKHMPKSSEDDSVDTLELVTALPTAGDEVEPSHVIIEDTTSKMNAQV